MNIVGRGPESRFHRIGRTIRATSLSVTLAASGGFYCGAKLDQQLTLPPSKTDIPHLLVSTPESTARPNTSSANQAIEITTLPLSAPEVTIWNRTSTLESIDSPYTQIIPKPETISPRTALNRETFSMELYDPHLIRYQNPDYTACVAADTIMMLNFIAANGDKGSGFRWKPTTTYAEQEKILAWERNNDTQSNSEPGVDPNGWRNGLNEFGWGSLTKMTYKVESFNSFDTAVKNAVIAMARYKKPVAILGWGGDHAQFLNGFITKGANPADSSDFTVEDVKLTDPLAQDNMRNKTISYESFKTGSLKYRFRAYETLPSTLDDPYTPGKKRADSAWYGNWVIVAPVK